MSARILLPRLRAATATLRPAARVGLGVSTLFAAHALINNPSSRLLPGSFAVRCDAAEAVRAFGSRVEDAAGRYSREARTPVVDSKGSVNPRVFRQLSVGSIAGLFGGLAVSVFSKPLAILIGLLVIGAQALQSSTGINVLPVNRLQRMVGNVDVRSMLQDDLALKLSFGATFLLAGFAEF